MAEQRPATYRDVFAVHEFRALWFAQLWSVVGDQFARVALAVLVFARTGSPGWTALTYALAYVPGIVGGPLLGGLADRFPRRRVMITADVARAALVAGMAMPGMPLVLVGGLFVVVQLLAAPFNSARAATLPLILEGDRYYVASSVSNMTYQLGQLLGFAAGGLLVAGVDPAGALLLDAGTFVVSAAVIVGGVKARPEPERVGVAGQSWGRQLGEGAHLVSRDRKLRALMGLMCVSAIPVAAEGLAVPYAADLHAGPTAVGLLLAAQPAGSVVGMVLIRRFSPTRRLRLMRPLAVASCGLFIVCAVQPGIAATIGLWTLAGAAAAYFVVANAAFVERVPDSQRGQAYGLASALLRASQGIAVLAAGAVAELLPSSVAIAAAGGAGALIAWAAGSGWLRASASADSVRPADGAG